MAAPRLAPVPRILEAVDLHEANELLDAWKRTAARAARLAMGLAAYRRSRDHRGCQQYTGMLGVDTRCDLCRVADELLDV